jgi:hypothetical protein
MALVSPADILDPLGIAATPPITAMGAGHGDSMMLGQDIHGMSSEQSWSQEI